LDLERKLGDLRLQQNKLQTDELLKKEADLNETIKQLKLKSKGKETIEIIQAEDKLKDLIREREKTEGAALAQIKLENKIAEAEILGEEELRQKEIADEKQAAADEAELERIKQLEEGKTLIKNAAVEAGERFLSEAFNNQNRRIDENLSREVEALNLKRQAGEISEEEFNKKRLELDKEAFKDRKRLSQVQNAIDFAVAAGKTTANLGLPAALPALAGLAIQKAAQAAIIASQKFADGGIIHGASHANGGVNVRVGGSGMIEAEGGEAIINKRSTKKHLGLLSAINMDGGGVSLASPNTGTLSKFGNGGIATTGAAQSQTLDLSQLKDIIVESQSELIVKNVASETTGVANRVKQIEDSASF